jgi:glycerol kinase
MLNIATGRWDDSMLGLLGVPRSVLPEIRPSAGEFGKTIRVGALPAGIPVAGVAGDQQSALFGQGCVRPGEMKVTYGTGGFLLLQTGPRLVRSKSGLLTTIACGPSGESTFALEGSVFIAGAVIQWLRDEMKLLRTAAESEAVARSVPDSAGVHIVPAFTGLGSPWWDAGARGTITGLTRGAGRAHLVRAALEAIAFQVGDVVEAMRRDLGRPIRSLRVDGGACQNDLLMQFQSDLVDAALVRPKLVETTAAGAACLAGLGVKLWSPSDLGRLRATGQVFRPRMAAARRRSLLFGWHHAVAQARLRA